MAYATSIHTQASGLMARIAQAVADVRERAARRRVYRQTYDSLSALSQRELDDIGLAPSMIAEVAREAAAE